MASVSASDAESRKEVPSLAGILGTGAVVAVLISFAAPVLHPYSSLLTAGTISAVLGLPHAAGLAAAGIVHGVALCLVLLCDRRRKSELVPWTVLVLLGLFAAANALFLSLMPLWLALALALFTVGIPLALLMGACRLERRLLPHESLLWYGAAFAWLGVIAFPIGPFLGGL